MVERWCPGARAPKIVAAQFCKCSVPERGAGGIQPVAVNPCLRRVETIIMMKDNMPIRAEMHIDLYPVDPGGETSRSAFERIGRPAAITTGAGDNGRARFPYAREHLQLQSEILTGY